MFLNTFQPEILVLAGTASASGLAPQCKANVKPSSVFGCLRTTMVPHAGMERFGVLSLACIATGGGVFILASTGVREYGTEAGRHGVREGGREYGREAGSTGVREY